MADHAAKIKQLEEYLQGLATERQRVIDATNAAAASTSNPQASRVYKEAGQRQLGQLDKYAKQATDARSFHQKQLYAKTPGSAGGSAAADKAQLQVDEQKPQAELAKNKQEQLKAFNTNSADVLGAGGKGFLDVLKAGPGVPNYTLGPDGNPITQRPYSVTMLVPKDKNDLGDKQALEEEKSRLLDRKKLDSDLAAAFITPTGKPPTADGVFGSGGIQFGPDGKVISNKTGFVFTGTPEQYYDLQKRYNESGKQEKENQRFNEVTVPADTYQSMIKKAGDIIGPGPDAPVSAIDKDIAARAMVANPRPMDANIGVPALDMQKLATPPVQQRIPNEAGVPQIGIGEDGATTMNPTPGLGLLEKWSRGVPAYVPAQVQAQQLADAESQKAWDARERQPDPAAVGDRMRQLQNSAIAHDPSIAFTVRPDRVQEILGQSTNPAINDTSYFEKTGRPFNLEQVAKFDYPTYEKLMQERAKFGPTGDLSPADLVGVQSMMLGANMLPDKAPGTLANIGLDALKTYGPSLVPRLPSDFDEP